MNSSHRTFNNIILIFEPGEEAGQDPPDVVDGHPPGLVSILVFRQVVPKVFRQDALTISAPGRRATIVTNPPYGERLLDLRSAEELYKKMGRHFRTLEPWQAYIITSHKGFEPLYGRRADKVKKLYNGMLPCYLYQFFKNNKK